MVLFIYLNEINHKTFLGATMATVKTINFNNCNIVVNVGKSDYQNIYTKKNGKPRTDIFTRIMNGENVQTVNRFHPNPYQRMALLAKLAQKGGLKCQNPDCKYPYENDVDALEIDHIDDNPLHNCLDNYQILCCVCNKRKGLKKTRK